MNIRHRALLIVFALLALSGMAAPAQAQDCNPQAEIERALFVLNRAREVVEQSPVPEAKELLFAARTRLKEAQGLAERGQNRFACERARVSQSLSAKAAEIAQRGIRGLEELQHMLERTDELLRDSANLVRQGGSDEGRRLLEAAVRQQKNARTEFRNRKPRVALKLTLMARETALRARHLSQDGSRTGGAALERELRFTDQLLTEARRVLEHLDHPKGAGELLEQAHRTQRAAWNRLRSGAPEVSLRMTRTARMMANRAIGQTDREPDAGDVRSLFDATAELIEDLRAQATSEKNDAALKLLDRAQNQLERAKSAADKGDLKRALGAVRAASSLALDVTEMLERGGEE